MEYNTPDTLLHNENAQLKQIIRENDNRIVYLEQKLKNATQLVNCILDNGNINLSPIICHSCREIYLYDEHSCSCNIFCRKSLCNDCYLFLKPMAREQLICQHPKCSNWYCDVDNCFLLACKDCKKKLCTKHYNRINIENKNWVCKDCCNKATQDYGFETV